MGPLGRVLSHPWAVRLAQAAIGVVFIVAGLAKVGDPGAFAEQIHNFRIMPVAFENLASGMGTAAFVAFAMALCNHRFSATQYALLSALASLRWQSGESDEDYKVRTGFVYADFAERSDAVRESVIVMRANAAAKPAVRQASREKAPR